MSALAADAGVELAPAVDRVVARLFLPGESTPGGRSRTEAVLSRVLALPPEELADRARELRRRFTEEHPAYLAALRANVALVHARGADEFDDDTALVVGAVFTAESAVEGAALCNPSAVAHPDQTRLTAGQLRVLLSVRSIGEGHLSSIQFCEAIVGPGRTWAFLPRETPLEIPEVTDGEWEEQHFLRALEHDGGTDDLVRAIGQHLPDHFVSDAVERAVQALEAPYLQHPGARSQLETVRIVAASAYRATFSADSPLSARVLLPVAEEERRGVEDLRLVRVDEPGGVVYRGTYTAYDGDHIASRLLETGDFRSFSVHRLTGPPARTKGMALFPRLVGGEHLALGRGDGESITLTRSADGFDWSPDEPVHEPTGLWEIVQTGNCGPPIETVHGWIVLTHGVGALRVYSIGALLLDLDDPTLVRAVLPGPLIEPPIGAGGYVPSVVYSCGGLVHNGILWVPYGIGDQRIRVASVIVEDLVGAMRDPGTARR